jgi:hypothetical protein
VLSDEIARPLDPRFELLRPVPDRPQPDDARINPPVAKRAGMKLLAQPTPQGNALLSVEFDPKTVRGDSVVIQEDGRRIVLRDDGREGDEKARDGFFSALVTVDRAQLVREQERLTAMARKAQPLALFERRQIVSRVQLQPIREQQKLPPSLSALPPVRPALEAKALEGRVLQVPVVDAQLIRPGIFIPFFPIGDPSTVDPKRSLLINDPAVVNDPGRTFNPCTNVGNPTGKWTFGHLMTQLANTSATGIPAAQFARRWLKRWEIDQTVNDFSVPKRQAGIVSKIINPWLAKSGGSTLDLTKAPFRLLAIVNRVDLRQNLLYGGGSAGEARFVFGAVDLNNSCQPLLFTVIFEFGIRKNSCTDLKAWGQQWFDLKNNVPGSPAFNSALEAITVQFTEAGTNPGQLPNRSSLNQLRTDEIALASPWELREFRLASDDSDAGHLRQSTTKQSPDDSQNHKAVINAYVASDTARILASKNVVPLEFPAGTAFLGGSSKAPAFWDGLPAGSIATPNLRHTFSLNTCNGCHSSETGVGFTHVKPEINPGTAGSLSTFLTGGSVADPVDGKVRMFNDLLRRQQDLANLVSQTCFGQIFFEPLNMTH